MLNDPPEFKRSPISVIFQPLTDRTPAPECIMLLKLPLFGLTDCRAEDSKLTALDPHANVPVPVTQLPEVSLIISLPAVMVPELR